MLIQGSWNIINNVIITHTCVHTYLCMYSNLTGSDYNSGPYNVTFPIRSTIASLIIRINDDDISENDETFNISITSITNGHIVGIPRVATVTIIDIISTYFTYIINMYIYQYVGMFVHAQMKL